MIGWKLPNRLGRPALLLTAALAVSCDVSSIVGHNQGALGTLRCGEGAPLRQCSTTACVVRELDPAQVGSNPIATDDDSVYYLREAHELVKAPVTGGDVVALAASDDGAFNMAVDATHLFWSEFGRRIWRVPKTGGAPEVVADIQGHPRVIALDESHVYATLTDSNQLIMTPKEPGKATFLSGQNAPYWIVTDTTHVYWINQGNAPNSGELVRAPVGDLTHAELRLQGLDSPVALAVSTTDAYLVAGQKLVRVPKNGGAVETLRDDLEETKSVAVYDDSVYLAGIAGLLRVTPQALTVLDMRTTLGLTVGCSGVLATGWLVPALLRYSP